MMPPPVPPTPPKQLNPTAPNFKIKEAKKAEKIVEKKAKADKAADKAARKERKGPCVRDRGYGFREGCGVADGPSQIER